ncbi:alpha/beta hydrolase [Candidatus Bathyarchaeota archaeon]|nr:alpha/beta hydrolase [Candidatus Bathyarchaeota archaeon]
MKTEEWTIFSTNLNEEREIYVYKPSGIEDLGEAYPVLYILDGDANFTYVAATVDYYIKTYRIPPVLVVGVNSTNRRRDFSLTHDNKSSPNLIVNEVGVENFTRFLKTELIPIVESKYQVMAYRVVAGHSLSASYVVNLLLTNIRLFNAYIVLSPYFTPIQEHILMKTEKLSSSKENPYRLLFIGEEKMNELRNLPTTEFVNSIRKIPNIETDYRKYNDADHMSIIVKAFPDALDYIFPGIVQDR